MRQKKKIQKKINGQISSANYGQMRLAATIIALIFYMRLILNILNLFHYFYDFTALLTTLACSFENGNYF